MTTSGVLPDRWCGNSDVHVAHQWKRHDGGNYFCFGATASSAIPDMVNHPPHYTDGPSHSACGKPIECIDVVEALGFNPGNAVKYIWRAGKKGDILEDLKKAEFYIKREIARLGKEADAI